MNVQLAPKLVMSMVSVTILMAVTIVHVCKDMKEMALTAQVINPLYMWLCMISSLIFCICCHVGFYRKYTFIISQISTSVQLLDMTAMKKLPVLILMEILSVIVIPVLKDRETIVQVS